MNQSRDFAPRMSAIRASGEMRSALALENEAEMSMRLRSLFERATNDQLAAGMGRLPRAARQIIAEEFAMWTIDTRATR
jgi:hypothetical protein